MRVLLIGAEPRKAERVVLCLRFRWPDAQAVMAAEGREGVDLVAQQSLDLVILHPNPSDMSTSEVIEEIRRFSQIPLVVLGKEDDGLEAINALELGADDYIRSPYEFLELVARISALLRRVPGKYSSGNNDAPILSGSLMINPATYEAFLDGRRLTLTYTEFRLMYLLVKNRGMVARHRFLGRILWGDKVDCSPLVKKYIQRLRRKLGDDSRSPQWIASVHGVGYRFVGPPDRAAEGPKSLAGRPG